MSFGNIEENETSVLPFSQLCRRFSLSEVQSATGNFNESLIIGRGGFGKVYKGLFDVDDGSHGTAAAIKRLDPNSSQGAHEFWTEIAMLSKFRHCNLVSLIGYCNEYGEMVLVYEYMSCGTLYDHLHKMPTRLSWIQLLKVCIGAARGLDYLHTGTSTQHRIIHRDVKSSNILLDENLQAKVSDFGLSREGPANQACSFVDTNVKGSFGYLDPEYYLLGRLTRKSDVYSFGVVLFEVLCGRRALDTSLTEEQKNLVNWVQNRNLDEIIDPRMQGNLLPGCLKEFAKIAKQCLHRRSNKRPTMAEVVARLESALALQEGTDCLTDEEMVSDSDEEASTDYSFTEGQYSNDNHPNMESPKEHEITGVISGNQDGWILGAAEQVTSSGAFEDEANSGQSKTKHASKMTLTRKLKKVFVASAGVALKSNVISFGKAVLETLTSLQRPNWGGHFGMNEVKLQELVDPQLKNNRRREGAVLLGTLAVRCLLLGRDLQPSLQQQVVEELEERIKVEPDIIPEDKAAPCQA